MTADVERCIADVCTRAVLPYLTHASKNWKWLVEGRVDYQLVDRLCRQLDFQGLAPTDLACLEGYAAIHAIAAAIVRTDHDPTRFVVHDEITYAAASPDWHRVMLTAHQLLWSQQYQVIL
jgi:hypothetical protein